MKKFLEMGIAPQFDNIPQTLRDIPRWLCWRLIPAEPKPKKVPMSPNSRGYLVNAAVNKPENWMTFDKAKSFFDAGKCTGIGFALTNAEPFVACVDVDHCFDSDGKLSDEAASVIKLCQNSWTEKSQSGEGIHVWVIDPDFIGGRRGGNVEVYACDRYIAVTGNALDNAAQIKHINGTCKAVIRNFIDASIDTDMFNTPSDKPKNKPARIDVANPEFVAFFKSDKLRRRDENAFDLFAGNIDAWANRTGKNNNRSVADASLMSKILFYIGDKVEPAQLKDAAISLFSQSELGKRDKWQREDYRERTYNFSFKNYRQHNEKTEVWQRANGKINPVILKNICAEAENFPPDTLRFDSDMQKTLGYFQFYDFFAPLAKNYLSQLKQACENARAAVDAPDNEASLDKQTVELAALDFPYFCQQVGNYKKAAKNEHLAYQEQARCEEENILRQSRAGKTTRDFVSDCPVELSVPLDCEFSEKGSWIIDNTGRFPKTLAATKNPVLPVNIMRNPENHETSYEVAIKTQSGWRKHFVDGQTLCDPKRILVLGGVGALIESATALTKFFARIVSENQLKEIKCYNQPGWHGNNFASFVYPGETEDYFTRRAGFDYVTRFAECGDKNDWRTVFGKVAFDHSEVVRLFIGVSLAALLVRPLNTPNLQIHLHSKSGAGKTALAKFAASIFGNPSHLIGTFAATVKNRQAQAAAYNDLPSFFDELETLNSRYGENTLSEMIYNYAEGKANQAQKRDGTAREPFYFAGARLMTAERPILKSHDQRGAYKRVIQIHCAKKLFPDDIAAALHVVAENNFGHFGRVWANFVQDNINDIRKQFNMCLKIFRDKNVEPTQFKAVTLALVAFWNFAVMLNFVDAFDFSFVEDDLNAILPYLPSLDELDDGTRCANDFASFIAGHEKFFASDAPENYDNINEVAQIAYECYGKKFKNGDIAVLPTAFKKIIEDELHYASADAILNDWIQRGWLILPPKGRGRSVSIRLFGKPQRVYRFKASFFSDDVFDGVDIAADDIPADFA